MAAVLVTRALCLAFAWARRLPQQTIMLPHERQLYLVVIVDDDQDLAETLVMLLEAEGYRALYALSGKTALALVEAESPNAVLLDYMLPDMSGGEVGQTIRALPSAREVRLLMYTSTPEEVVRPLFDGYDVFLGKPVLHDRLVTALDRVLAGVPSAHGS